MMAAKNSQNTIETTSPKSSNRPVTDGFLSKKAEATLATLDELTRELSDEYQIGDLPYAIPEDFLLSIVVPIFNEEETVARVIQALFNLPLPVEVIAVDDGSTDGTVAKLTELNQRFPELRVCIQQTNCGKGAALRRGFEMATGSHVMVQDADLEYDPQDIPGLIEPLINGEADAVYGSRFLENKWQGSSIVHRLGNRALTMFSNWMTGLKLTDMETCYKVIRRDLLETMRLEQDRFGFEVELTSKLAKQRVQIVERPVSYDARGWEDGKKIGWRDAVQALYCIVRYG